MAGNVKVREHKGDISTLIREISSLTKSVEDNLAAKA